MERVVREAQRAESRGAAVDQLRQQMDSIFAACERARSDAGAVLEARADLSDTRERLEALLSQASALDQRYRGLEARRESLDDVEQRLDSLKDVMGDVQLNLESFKEEKAIIDHVSEKVARLEFTIKKAEAVTRELADERQISDRIHQGIRSVRSAKVQPEEGEVPARRTGNS